MGAVQLILYECQHTMEWDLGGKTKQGRQARFQPHDAHKSSKVGPSSRHHSFWKSLADPRRK